MSVRFSAVGQVYTAANGSLGTGDFTVLCWGRVAVDRDTYSTFVAVDDGTSTQVCALQAGSDGTLATGWVNAGGFTTTLNLIPGTWYRMALTRSGSTVTGYYGAQGAVLISNFDTLATTMTASNLRLGNSVANEWMNGNIANVKVYSAVLTTAEMEAEWASIEAVRTANLVRHHKLQVAETTDYSGNGNTLSGGTGATTEADPSIGSAPPIGVSARAIVADATAATTTSAPLTGPTTIAVGNYLIARVAVDNSGTNGAAPGCTVTDPRSNTWTVLGPALVDPGVAAAGATAYLCYTRVVTAYQAADALTFNWGGISTTAKAIVVEEWANLHPTSPVAVSAVTANAAASTAVTVSITPTAPNQLVYTCLATEGIAADTFTGDADTTNGTWTTLAFTASANATATNNQRVSGQYKVVTAAGAQSWDATITNRDWAALAVVFAPLPLPPVLWPRRRGPNYRR